MLVAKQLNAVTLSITIQAIVNIHFTNFYKMKTYIIYPLKDIFECKEVVENGLTLLIGKFKGEGKKYTFIKSKKDIEILSPEKSKTIKDKTAD